MKSNDVKRRMEISYILYQHYKHIIESYVSDYYVENHWNKLPTNWQNCFKNVSIEQIGELLDFKKQITGGIYPLSLLCLRNVIINNVISRDKISKNSVKTVNSDFLKYFWKNVKLKKRHEIDKIAQTCLDTATNSNCFYIVDIGSGVGHLSRMLAFGYGFKVCTFEANPLLSNLAKELDNKFKNDLIRKSIEYKNTSSIIHINKKVECDINWKMFLKIVVEAFNEDYEDFKFGIVGLHPCGNLGSTLLRLYKDCSNVIFINMASCCYMKLTLEPDVNFCFPLSDFCKINNFKLSYLACEIACHAIESYAGKLKNPEDYFKLKIHAYRARLEEILVSMDETKLKHSAVCNIKYTEGLPFKKYCDKVFNKLAIVPPVELVSVSDELINRTWRNVVVFYSVRLLFAPLIETIILFDRLLYVREKNQNGCEILPIFDCNISPRNHVLIAEKKFELSTET